MASFGFIDDVYGKLFISNNGVYKGVYSLGVGSPDLPGYKNGYLVLACGKKTLFKKEMYTPQAFCVSDNGLVFGFNVYSPYNSSSEFEIKAILMNEYGIELWSAKGAFATFCCAISSDSNYIAFEVFGAGKNDRNIIAVYDAKATTKLLSVNPPIGKMSNEMFIKNRILTVDFGNENIDYMF